MSYQLKIDRKSQKVAKFISQLQRKIQAELIASGMTQQEVAELLGVGRSVINRRLKGGANLTARSIAEFAYAFDKEINLDFVEKDRKGGQNYSASTDTIFDIQGKENASTTGSPQPNTPFIIESAAS